MLSECFGQFLQPQSLEKHDFKGPKVLETTASCSRQRTAFEISSQWPFTSGRPTTSRNVHLFLSLNRCLHVNRFKNDFHLLQMGSLAKHEANVWKE
jgi:hypothetical protein